MKKGFTLIELLAVIIILAVIALIATPIVLNVVDNAKESARKSSVAGFADAVKLVRTEAQFNNLPFNDNDLSDLSIETNTNNVTCGVIRFTTTDGVILNNCTVQEETNYCYKRGIVEKDDNCTTLLSDVSQEPIVAYVEAGINKPELLNGMIPIKYVTDHWVYADISQEWYSYNNQEWANAVILNTGVTKNVNDTINESDIALWYVWIPRYKYTTFSSYYGLVDEQLINVVFETGISTTGTVKCHDVIGQTNGDGDIISEVCWDSTKAENAIADGESTYTHPGFCLGTKNNDGSCNGDELTGFWIGKFKLSSDTTCTYISDAEIGNGCNLTTLKPVTRPNLQIWRGANISVFFNAIDGIETTYGIVNGDSHMIKNMEWGAVAYLKQSQYGLGMVNIGLNNFSNNYYRTGCGAEARSKISTTCNAYDTADGKKASTTGNIYGVYDMPSGTWENTMSNISSSSDGFVLNNSVDSDFWNNISDKYYEKYSYSDEMSTVSRGKLGDATRETIKNDVSHGVPINGWYGDYKSYFPSDIYGWFARGGNGNSQSGVFSIGRTDEIGEFTTRIVLSKK